MLDKLPVMGRPTSLDYRRVMAYYACSRCRWGCFDIFLSRMHFSSFPSLWETARYRLKYCLKGSLNPNQSTSFFGACYLLSFCVFTLFS